jgi:hypothetical protein
MQIVSIFFYNILFVQCSHFAMKIVLRVFVVELRGSFVQAYIALCQILHPPPIDERILTEPHMSYH